MPFQQVDRRMVSASGLAALLLAACGSAGALDGLPQGREGLVTAVLAGDVLQLDGKEVVKLAGVYAPQTGQPYAAASREILEGLVKGRRVILFFGGVRQDRLGRTLAQVEDAENRRWIQGALLEAGGARVRTYVDDRIPARAMLAREAAARRARRGLWIVPTYEVRLPDEIGSDETGFMVVEGRVRRVGDGRQTLYVDFRENWRDSVSVTIPREALRDFRTAGVDPSDLTGRMIRVRGVVDGRRLAVDHPEQIEILSG